MSETHEAAGQHMQEEAADKFVRVERYSLDTIALTTITRGKADAPITHVEDPMVGNGDAMGIAADIVQDVCRTCQGRLGVDDPVFSIELRTKLLEVLRCTQDWGAQREGWRWWLPGPALYRTSREKPCSRPAPERGSGDRHQSSAYRWRKARQPP